MAWIDAGDARLYYEVHGDQLRGAGTAPRAAPWLVLLHGVGGNHASWFFQVTALRERFRVVVVDARGFGRSTDPRGLGRDAFVEDLERVFEDAGIDRAVLVGQSMGAGTAIAFTCRHAHRVRALVVADSLFGIELPVEVGTRMAEVTKRTAEWPQAQRVMGPRFRREQPAMATLYAALASFNAVNVRTLAGVQCLHPPHEIAATGVPLLLLVGAEDALFPADAVRAVHDEIPGSTFVELPDVGHSAYFEAPDEFNRVILQWLASKGAIES